MASINEKPAGEPGKPRNLNILSRKRLILCFLLVVAAFGIIAVRVGYIQIIKADEYSKKALDQQTRDQVITAKRGSIYDKNMKALALNQASHTIWVRTSAVRDREAKEAGFTKEMAGTLAKLIPDAEKNELYKKLLQDSSTVKIVKYADDDTTEKIRKAGSDGKLEGIQISDTVRRYYPMGAFAAHVLGNTNDDNTGIAGLEQYYDQYLNGKEGRWIKSSDRTGRSLTNGIEKYYAAEDGLSVVLTIDEVIQHYVESAIEDVQKDTRADKVMAIVSDPKTGDVLAMASYPDYDPNEPRVPLDEAGQKELKALKTDAEQMEYLNKMWRNPLVNDTFEPGSPFKLLTTAMALEEDKTFMSDQFYCSGSITLYGQKLNCWLSPGSHGSETLRTGVANSCNPVFITLSQRLGITKFYQYLEKYGFMNRTGVDYPGEAKSQLQDRSEAGPIGLATMSYGQGIACTPVQIVTALSAAGNGGKMMRPHLVSRLIDSDGKTVKRYDPEVIRQVISEETAANICELMEGVVSGGTGNVAYISGYRIGGKTGTANKTKNGRYTDSTYSSFFAMAPMDDPEIAVYVAVDNPKGTHYGSQTAGPGVRAILMDVLQYLKVQPVYSDGSTGDDSVKTAKVPSVTGMTDSEAKSALKAAGFTTTVIPADATGFKVVDQYPKAGEEYKTGNAVCIYQE